VYQLCLGDETFSAVLDRIAERACAVAPGLDHEACRNLVDLVFRARVRKTEACGKHPECVPVGPVWGQGTARQGETADWEDLDPQGLPAMFATAAADLARTPPMGRHAVEERLAHVFRTVLAGLLFCNPRCGRSEICGGEPVYPFQALGRRER
jgi:hypothetical protein